MAQPDEKRNALAFRSSVVFVITAVFFWTMFLLLEVDENTLLTGRQFSVAKFGFGLLNAIVLTKVIYFFGNSSLIGWLRSGPLIAPVLLGSAGVAAIFIAIDVAEKLLVGAYRGTGIAESLPTSGAGSLPGTLLAGVIIALVLIPYFALEEVSLVFGYPRLSRILLGRETEKRETEK